LCSEANRRMGFPPLALLCRVTRKSGLLPSVGKSEYHLRVAQANVTFALIGKAKSTAGLFHDSHDDHLVRQFSRERLASTRFDKGTDGIEVDARNSDYTHGIAVAQFLAQELLQRRGPSDNMPFPSVLPRELTMPAMVSFTVEQTSAIRR
jgi:hypothetical protein